MKQNSTVDVSVLTPVLNGASHLPGVLDRMRKQVFDGTIEFLFIDGGSADGSRQIIAEAATDDPRIRLLENSGRTTPKGLNIGLAEAQGEYVARMDAHTYYPPDYLQVGIDRLREGDVDWVAGPAIATGDKTWSRRVAVALSSLLGTGGAKFRSSGQSEFDAITGFTGVWRRENLESHGGWDEGWPVNQDAELAARTRARGERIVCVPAMASDYRPRDDLRGLARQYFRYGMYRCKTSVRHPESIRFANLMPAAVALASVVALLPIPGVRRLARLAVSGYAAVAVGESIRLSSREGELGEAPMILTVFATMHLSNGFGFLFGCLRFGIPVTGIRAIMRRHTDQSLRRVA